MKNRIYRSLIIIFYVLSLFILLFCLRIRLMPGIYIRTEFKLILLFIVCVLIYTNGYLLTKKLNYSTKILKINLITYFLIYVLTIFSLTLFDEALGRQGLVFIKWNSDTINTYMKESFNIIPFNTIKLFVNGYNKGLINTKSFVTNIIGNICAFMPCGLFLPLIFKKMNNYYRFLIDMIFMVIIIELLQFVTMSGSCDIDDLILNIFGASIVYFIVKIKCVNKYIRKILLYE